MSSTAIAKLLSGMSRTLSTGSLGNNDEKKRAYDGLELLIAKHCHDQRPHIFLHPTDFGDTAVSPGLRKYTQEEVLALQQRDFETRLFITANVFEGDSVWLRTHFSDNHIHTTTIFNSVRDYFKATHATKNYTAAKSALAEVLTTCMEVDKGNYYSFATTMASGLSNYGENTSFERHRAMLDEEDDVDMARKKLCLIMHIIFTRISASDFLLEQDGSNIYRLVYCMTRTSKRKISISLLPWFSFLLQMVLTIFVVFEIHTTGSPMDNVGLSYICLACINLIYSAAVAWPGIMESIDAFVIYEEFGPMQLLDCIANIVLPPILSVYGFMIIIASNSLINSVLNCAALLYIAELDDTLPVLLGFSPSVIAKDFLTYTSTKEFDRISMLEEEDISYTYLNTLDNAIGVQFSDFYLTNWPEHGSIPETGEHLKPHQITKRGAFAATIHNTNENNRNNNNNTTTTTTTTTTNNSSSNRHQQQFGQLFSPTNYVTETCLIRKITWLYTTGSNSAIKPRIGYLCLKMINGETIEINMQKVDNTIQVEEDYHQLEGVFIITSLQMSSTILRLRVCGSYNAIDFAKAFDYYSLWDITSTARSLLKRYQKYQDKHPRTRNYRSFRGYSTANGFEYKDDVPSSDDDDDDRGSW